MKDDIVTDALVDSLMEDWLERDGETFTYIRKKGRLGWEKELSEGSSYSAYLLEAPTKEDLIKRAYSLARDTITAMDPPFKVTIKITNDVSGGTDGKMLYVSTKVFDDPELSVGEKLDTFLGITVHEGCHLLYTDLEWLSKISIAAIREIWNIIEDERIERLCGDLKPGFANFLEKSKYYFFDQYYIDVIAGKKEEELTPFIRLINCFMRIIRYPRYLKESEIIEFAKYLTKIKEVMLPYPTTTEEAVKTAYRVFDIIKELYIDKEREETKKSKSSSGESKDSAEGDDGTPERSESEIEASAMRKLSSDVSKDIDKLRKATSSGTDALSGLSMSEMSDVVEKGLFGKLCEGTLERGSSSDSYFTKAVNAEAVYRKCAERVRRYVPAMARIMKGHCRDYKLIHRSMRSGVLDTGKLAEAVQGVPTVYMREGAVRTDRIAVCVLIDESGSMCGRRIDAARDAAVLINEAIGTLPNVELFIYGHTGDTLSSRSTELSVYREKGYAPRYSLGSVDARSENRDGVAIMEVTKRVRAQTKSPVLMFVLSDGSPCAGGYSGLPAMEHVKNCVKKAENMGFFVIQVCINHVYDPSKMFKHFIILEDMSTLAFELSKHIKKSAMQLAKVHVI